MPDLTEKLAALSPEQRKKLLRRIEQNALRASQLKDRPPHLESSARQPDSDLGNESHDGLRKGKALELSLLFFSGNGATKRRDKYELLLESARFADKHNFCAVWVPERHFQEFGGLYPNPSILGGALSMITEKIRIRAGSVVLPLHNPIRVAEEWSVVDNLSGGRVEISFASGYHPGDFMLAPDNYVKRKDIMFSHIDVVRRLWAGEAVEFAGVNDEKMNVRILPTPLQPELPFWVTSSSSVSTWIRAGEIGANILSGFSGITDRPIEEMANKISIYRESLAGHGYDPQSRRVAVMMHTFVDRDMDSVRRKVEQPLSSYLRTFMAQDEYLTTKDTRLGVAGIKQEDRRALVSYAVERFIASSSLIGTPDSCMEMLHRLEAIGVDEAACFIDFGPDTESVLESLTYLNESIARHRSGRAQETH